MDVHNIVFENLTKITMFTTEPVNLSDFGLEELSSDETCSYCKREIKQQPEILGNYGFNGKKSYGIKVKICACCEMFFLNNPSIMGIEKETAPQTGNKWGMLKGSGVFIDIDSQQTVVFMPEKSFIKLPAATLKIAHKDFNIKFTHELGSINQLIYISKLNVSGACIWISDLGRRTEVLISNLTISPSIDQLTEINDSEKNSSSAAMLTFNLNNAVSIAEILNENKKNKKLFIDTMRNFSNGKISPERMMASLGSPKLAPFSAIMPLLPSDPHLRISMLQKASKL